MAGLNERSKPMRYTRGYDYVQRVVPQPCLSTRLHQMLMATTLALGLSLVPVLATAGPFRGVVVFGDSLSDSGNVFAATKPVLAKAIPVSPPYFQGRFSNGPVWVDILAEQLGLPLRPFLQGGTNFAFGGAATGFDRPDLFENDVRVLIPSLRTQVTTFLVQHLFDKADPAALYIVWGGANDLRDALVTAPDPFAEAHQAVEDLAAAITDLAEARAVSFVVPNMPNLARLPESRRRDSAAMAQATAVSVAFNDALRTALDALEAAHPITIIRLDTFTLLEEIIRDPDRFDLSNVTEPCLAGDPFTGGMPCPQPKTHLFWDSIHPTTAAHALLADLAVAALAPLRVAQGDTSPAPSIKDALRALLPLSLKDVPGKKLRLDRWLHW
jgi:phospholipase/lecithinase/hemolysin